MAQENRIRLDITSKSSAKLTKTTVVEAVKLIEQDPNLGLKGSSRDLINDLYSSIFIHHNGKEFTMTIIWNNSANNMEVEQSSVNFVYEHNRINYAPVVTELPKKIVELVKLTDKVLYQEINDNFV